ncbi:MAG: NAD-dependent malic enzyme [Austwickia sp.]|nr:MAG: NAD-dependent malic enzyme [Austwickia sp.]
MVNRNYEFVPGPRGQRLKIHTRGSTIMTLPTINRGTAFTWPERHAFGLTGLLPPGVATLDWQVRRSYENYLEQSSPVAKYAYLAGLRDRNEVLFYRLLSEHLEEMLPIVYTPTIGDVIERFSHTFSRMRGVFTSVDFPEEIEESLLNYGLEPDQCDLIVVTDSEGILGIGDQGVGGVQICVGKLSVYTAAAGIDPRRVIPVVVDVGTDNMELLNDEFYLGSRHSRRRGAVYDEFIEQFVATATRLFPHAMIHFEDFGAGNAHRILDTYRHRYCAFNDDIQGTAAVVTAAALAGVKTTGSRMREQRVVVFGAGTAGVGIADLMRDRMIREGLGEAESYRQFWCLGSRGLIHTGLGEKVRDFQQPYARPQDELASWQLDDPGNISLADVVRNVRPTMLIGTSARAGAFTEAIVRDMAAHVDRPIIMPLSNPTSRAEAVPKDIIEWTNGQALVATGSPFAPVEYGGRRFEIAQANNALVFPGIGLGVVVSKASRVSDRMIAAAAEAVAEIVDVAPYGRSLLPSISQLRRVSGTVAIRVAETAYEEGLSQVKLDDPVQRVYEAMWQPVYPEIILPPGDWKDMALERRKAALAADEAAAEAGEDTAGNGAPSRDASGGS